MIASKPRVRFAPSPTGPLHMGGVRTALYNYLFARNTGGSFIVRIEDTDQNRFVEGAEPYIFEALKWCGLEPDESPVHGGDYGPYRQSERKTIYGPYALDLVANGHAYYAFDTEEEVASCRKAAEAEKKVWQYDATTRINMRNSLTLDGAETQRLIEEGHWTIRFKMPDREMITFTDRIRGEVSVNSSVLDDKVLMKSDGMPTYHLANVIDDHLMKVSHVIRGEEWLPSAPLHVMLYRAFGWEHPEFAHLPLILKPEGNGKLSKRDGDKGGFPVFPIEWIDPTTSQPSPGYRESGYFSEAFVNMLLMLGWNSGTEQELFTREEMIQAFSLDRVVKSGARFNPDKARWFNESYLRSKTSDELAPLLEEAMATRRLTPAGTTSHALISICEMMKERCSFVHEMTAAEYLFKAPATYDEKVVKKRWKEQSAELMAGLADALSAINEFGEAQIEKAFNAYLEANELSVGQVLPQFRLLLTGEGGGPSMFAIAAYLGRETTMERLRNGIQKLG